MRPYCEATAVSPVYATGFQAAEKGRRGEFQKINKKEKGSADLPRCSAVFSLAPGSEG